MSFFVWCILITILAVVPLTISLIAINKEWAFAPALFGGLCFLIAIVSWITLAIARNDENIDRNYCESLIARGHKTQFFRYNVFNHDCYILVDNQWIVIDDVDLGRRNR